MSRSWLNVTTGEVRAKSGADERLAARRAEVAKRAEALAAAVIAPVLTDAAAQRPAFEMRDDGANDWSAVRLGLYEKAAVANDPRAAFFCIEVDAYQPIVVVRRKARGAAAAIRARTVHADALDRDTLQGLLFGD